MFSELTCSKWQQAEQVDDGLVLGVLAMLIGAGSDTTSTVLQNFFKIIALHPEVVAAAQEGLLPGHGRRPRS